MSSGAKSSCQTSIRLRQLAGMLAASRQLPPDSQITPHGRAPVVPGAPATGLKMQDPDHDATTTLDRYRAGSQVSVPSAFAALIGVTGILTLTFNADAQTPSRRQAMAAAIHPVADTGALRHWLARVPATRDFPPDLAATLRAQAPLYVIEMTTAPGCLPCADLWGRLQQLRIRYGWEVRTISGQDALLRSGRLGLPWVGHPVAWVRPRADHERMIPIAVGTDHEPNLARNLYLAAKMLTGVRPAVAVRAMSKFTGIVGQQRAVRKTQR
jgi:hypothetical protein